MDSLEKELLLRDVEKYGYHLALPGTTNPAQVLQRMLMSDDGRVLEGVPVVLTNVLLSNKTFDLKSVESSLPSALQKRFRVLAAVTYLFLFWVSESDSARKLLNEYLKEREPALTENVTEKLRTQHKVQVGNSVVLDEARLEKTYKNYVVQQFIDTQTSVTKKLDEQRSTLFTEAASELFTEKQKELMFKMLNHEPLTKTEREYYSRSVKPRLKALRNPDLQTTAATLLGY
jgi:hypothetical protein